MIIFKACLIQENSQRFPNHINAIILNNCEHMLLQSKLTKLLVQRAWGHYILWEYGSLLRNPRCFVDDDSGWKIWKQLSFDFACHGKAGPQQCGLEVTVWVSKAH